MAVASSRADDEEIEMPDEHVISWRSIVYGTPVMSSEGERAGEVHEVLGSDAQDIFHGLRVRLVDRERDVMVPADAVASMADDGVRTRLSSADLKALPAYDETATYHLASVGWLRKHIGWERDAGGDRGRR